MSADDKPKPAKRAPSRGLAYLRERHDPLTSLVLTLPVFVIYHLGILLMPLRNGVDLVSGLTFELLERSRVAYIGVTLGIAAALIGAVAFMRKRGTLKPAEMMPVIVESTLWAVVMAFTVGWAVSHLFAQIGPRELGPLERVVMSAGAGFHEEIVFRVALFGGGAFLLAKGTKLDKPVAEAICAVLFALVFSAVHYIGALGDAFSIVSFAFRFGLGLFLTALYRYRGFAVAVYTHFIYDLIVMFLR